MSNKQSILNEVKFLAEGNLNQIGAAIQKAGATRDDLVRYGIKGAADIKALILKAGERVADDARAYKLDMSCTSYDLLIEHIVAILKAA